jgi:hypothetical protein
MHFAPPIIFVSAAIALGLGPTVPPVSLAQTAATGAVKTLESPAASRVSKPKSFAVPAGNNYVLRTGRSPNRSTSFDKLTSGQVLEDTHCVQINCPPGMQPGTVCWRCYEIAAPDAE